MSAIWKGEDEKKKGKDGTGWVASRERERGGKKGNEREPLQTKKSTKKKD